MLDRILPVNKLDEICATKRSEVAARKQRFSLAALDRLAAEQPPARDFLGALQDATPFALIAEIKRASPSKGLIREDFDPPTHARAYQAGGAACLSVLTDAPYFQGHEDYLVAARDACTLPVLRKDFTVDPWQVAEARAIGADAILIIVAALDDGMMRELEQAALHYGMDVLIEVHDQAELDRALQLQSRLIGVNNRDLKTFEVDLRTTLQLARHLPADYLLVAESGIATHDDLRLLRDHGITAALVGESLMRQADIFAATRQLIYGTLDGEQSRP